jgi:hypothetical protein
MANVKISALPAASSLVAGDDFPVVQSGPVTRQATISLITTGLIGTEPSTGSAATGALGEFVTANLASGSATALTSPTAKNVISISLTAGDWDVSGGVSYTAAGTTTITLIGSCISNVSGAYQANGDQSHHLNLNGISVGKHYSALRPLAG